MINWEQFEKKMVKQGLDAKTIKRIKENEFKYSYNYLRVLNRDKWKCRICGIKLLECKTGYHVHHIDGMGWRKHRKNANNSMGNLISLCASCHIITHNKIFDKCRVDGCDRYGNCGDGYCKKHSPKEKEGRKIWSKRNIEKRREYGRIRRQKPAHKEYMKEYRKKNKDKIEATRRKYLARKAIHRAMTKGGCMTTRYIKRKVNISKDIVTDETGLYCHVSKNMKEECPGKEMELNSCTIFQSRLHRDSEGWLRCQECKDAEVNNVSR